MDEDSISGDDTPRQPIDQVLQGLELSPLEVGATALEAFVVIKVLEKDGETGWSFRTTHRLNREELLGALTVQVEVLRRSLVGEWFTEDGDLERS